LQGGVAFTQDCFVKIKTRSSPTLNYCERLCFLDSAIYFLSQCKTSGGDGCGRGGTVLNLFGNRKIGFGFDSKSGLIALLFLYKKALQVGQKFSFNPSQPGHTIVV